MDGWMDGWMDALDVIETSKASKSNFMLLYCRKHVQDLLTVCASCSLDFWFSLAIVFITFNLGLTLLLLVCYSKSFKSNQRKHVCFVLPKIAKILFLAISEKPA